MAKRMVERRNSIDYEHAECEITQKDITLFARAYDDFFTKRQVSGSMDNRTNLPRSRPAYVFAPFGEMDDDRKEA